MEINFLEYNLVNGFIHRWLVAGPQIIPIKPQDGFSKDDMTSKQELLRQFRIPFAGITQPAVEFDKLNVDCEEFRWDYYNCLDDHQVHGTSHQTNWHILRNWAYTQIHVPDELQVTFNLFTRNPIQVWLNNQIVFQIDGLSQDLEQHSFQAKLKQKNELLILSENVSRQNGRCEFALRVSEVPGSNNLEEIKIIVPTHARFTDRYKRFERLFENAYLENIVKYYGDHFNLRWNEEVRDDVYYEHRIQDELERNYAGGRAPVDPRNPRDVGHQIHLFERTYFVTLMAPEREYWEHHLRYTKRLPIHILDHEYTEKPYGSHASRRIEALKHAAKQENDLFGMIALLELGQWIDLKTETILQAIQQIENRDTGCELLLVGLLLLMYRFQANQNFPVGLIEPIKQCVLQFNYDFEDKHPEWQSGQNESRAILTYCAEIMAGQLYPMELFTISKKPGEWHKRHGNRNAIAWLHQKGQFGFSDWNSNSHWHITICALAQLTTLAKSRKCMELAAVVLDKMLFLLALNSYKGSFASSHGVTSAEMLKSSQLEATSGIMRMLWGIGVFNHHICGIVSLACSDYEYPAFYHEIANEQTNEILSKERHAVSPSSEVNLVTFRTPDYVLSSAQDYQPGLPGSTELIWKATMGNEAIVFVNHPSCSSEANAYQPGFWLGNGCLPRVVQWKDALIAIYHLPDKDWMGFTHAYFPLPAFDDFFLSERWAFLKKGSGYLALGAANGIQFIRQGPNAYRELRSYGLKNIWVCQMGRENLDGDFSEFRKKVLALKFKVKDLSIFFNTLRNEELSFNWEGPLRVNGIEQPAKGDKHIENTYCTAEFPSREMQISFEDFLLRLNFQ